MSNIIKYWKKLVNFLLKKQPTYLDIDHAKRVHDFLSLAQTKQETFVEIDAKRKHTTTKLCQCHQTTILQ